MTLKWELNSVPTKYAPDIVVPPSMIPTPTTTRKLPTDRSSPDETSAFNQADEIKDFSEISDELCPVGYKLEVQPLDNKAIFNNMEKNSIGIPEVAETIVLDEKLHVKLYKTRYPYNCQRGLRRVEIAARNEYRSLRTSLST